jgi:ATP-dependent protease HslVU (ClpYQ) peptidase subunit
MSVVAVKINQNEINISSDSIIILDDSGLKINDKHSKLTFLENIGLIIGDVGDANESQLFINYVKKNYNDINDYDDLCDFIAEFNFFIKEKLNALSENQYIIIDKNLNKVYLIQGFYVREVNEYFAIGSGSPYAFSALYLGFDTEKAVEVACQFSNNCSLPIMTYKIKKIK